MCVLFRLRDRTPLVICGHVLYLFTHCLGHCTFPFHRQIEDVQIETVLHVSDSLCHS